MPGLRFVRNVLLFSIAGLLPVLLLFVSLSPGFASSLLEGGPALHRFLRQIVTNGLPVVFVTNYVTFFLFALSQNESMKALDPGFYAILDLPLRTSIFLVLHAIIYVLSADWFGSFGGSRITALSVVAPTLARSALFENVSGVYLYSTFVSAFPLYVSSIGRSEKFGPAVSRVPFGLGPLLSAFLWFAVSIMVLTSIAIIVSGWQS